MKIVLDTNVLVSAIFFSGLPARILSAWTEGRFEMLASLEILAEYRGVVARLEKQFPTVEAHSVLDHVVRECRFVEPVSIPKSVCDDPDDLKFLACAVAGRAKCIVTGDKALLRAAGYERLEIWTPRAFATRYL